tara:strand:- start:2535 stop:2807 length:273 start_codon:yes stop_codon:yes gene_type:complete
VFVRRQSGNAIGANVEKARTTNKQMNNQIIYKDKGKAKEACEKYKEELEKLQDDFGITTVETSTCGETFATVTYINEWTGEIDEFWHPVG